MTNLFSRVKAAEPHSGTRLERNDTGSSGTDDVESGAGSAAGTAQQVSDGNLEGGHWKVLGN